MLKKNTTDVQRKKKGQSTVEYIILVAGVIAALLIFLRPNGPFNVAFNSTLNSTTGAMTHMATTFANSHGENVQ
ncbi:MAG: class III signal peptide-containing protein [Candidatus Omnitrophica bacterium]|nr:class III signal peptide-containing protein [Candidatus Omnitrophota bacterium]